MGGQLLDDLSLFEEALENLSESAPSADVDNARRALRVVVGQSNSAALR